MDLKVSHFMDVDCQAFLPFFLQVQAGGAGLKHLTLEYWAECFTSLIPPTYKWDQ